MAESRSYWQSAVEDEAMQDAHGFVWKAMLETIDVDLSGTRVLDAGCNRGGFLRLLCDVCHIAEGHGYDPALGAVDDAVRLAAGRPLRFEVAETVPAGWKGFDIAFSHEVLYLIHDLPAHAAAIFGALVPGGAYYAVMGVHTGSPYIVDWHREHAEELQMPPLYDIGEVSRVFETAGFEVAGSRLQMGFVPASGHASEAPQLLPRLEYYYDHKLFLRFTRPLRS